MKNMNKIVSVVVFLISSTVFPHNIYSQNIGGLSGLPSLSQPTIKIKSGKSADPKYARQEKINYEGRIYYSVHINLADSVLTIPNSANTEIRNPFYLGKGYFEWEWFHESVTGNHSSWEFVEKEYPVKEHYNVDKNHPDYKIKSGSSNGIGWLLCNMNNSLACAWVKIWDTDLLKAAMIYDFENNAYDIDKESDVIKKMVKESLYDKIGSEEELGALIGEELYINQEKNRARGLLALGLISQKEYDRIIEKLKSRDLALAKRAKIVSKNQPSYEDKDKAKRYVAQLKKDNESIINVSGWDGHIKCEQLDGTHFSLRSVANNFKALATVYLDKQGKDHLLIKVISK